MLVTFDGRLAAMLLLFHASLINYRGVVSFSTVTVIVAVFTVKVIITQVNTIVKGDKSIGRIWSTYSIKERGGQARLVVKV